MRIFRLLLAAPIFLVGCAAVSGDGHLASDDARVLDAAPVCCEAIGEVGALAKPLPDWSLVDLSVRARHRLHYGSKLPFDAFKLGSHPRASEITLLSYMRFRGWAYGGDGLAHYAAAIPVFFDSEDRLLATAALERRQVSTTIGRALEQRYTVPPNAVLMVITVDASQIRSTDSSRVVDAPNTVAVVGTTPIAIPGGLLPVTYRLAAYGSVAVYPSPSSSK